jgi:hypothetical protein
VYITKTRTTRMSNMVFFKHQYITNPEVSPETMVIQAAQHLTSALQGTISQESETAEALKKVSELFTKIAAAKAAGAKAKEQRNRLQTHTEAQHATPSPRFAGRAKSKGRDSTSKGAQKHISRLLHSADC